MTEAFITVSQFFARSLGLLWSMLLGWGSAGAIVLAVLLFKRVARLVSKLIKH